MTNMVKRYGLIGIAIVFLAAAIVGWTQLRNPMKSAAISKCSEMSMCARSIWVSKFPGASPK